MKKALSIALLSLAGVCTSFAAPVPQKCPSAEGIKSVPLTMPVNLGVYSVASMGDYDHDGNYWLFVLGLFEAQSDEEALAKGNAALSRVYGNPSPEPVDGSWMCVYPIRDGDTELMGLAQYIGDSEPTPDAAIQFMQRYKQKIS